MKELREIQSRLQAPKNQWNKFGNYAYRNCEDIFEGVKPLLKELECTLKIDDELVLIGDRYYIKATATLKNEKGDVEISNGYAREEESKKGMDSSQVTGASSSYARKYALNGLFCIDDAKDSDTGDHKEERTTHAEQVAKKASVSREENKKDFSQKELTEWIDEFKDESDVNHLATLWKEFSKFQWSEKQLKWATEEKDKQKVKLNG